MPPSDLLTSVRQRLSDAVYAQNRRLEASLAKLLEENEAAGKLRSNETLKQSTLLCCDTLEKRADGFVTALKELIANASAAREISKADLKKTVAEFMRPDEPFIAEKLAGIIQKIGAPDVLAKLKQQVEKSRSKAITRLGVEIDLIYRRSITEEATTERSRHIRTGLLLTEMALLAATGWYTYMWFANPTTLDGVIMTMTGIMVLVVNRMRRFARENH